MKKLTPLQRRLEADKMIFTMTAHFGAWSAHKIAIIVNQKLREQYQEQKTEEK